MAAMAFVSQRLTTLTPLRVRPLPQSKIWQGPGQARHTMRERHDVIFFLKIVLETIRLRMFGACSEEAVGRSSLYFISIYFVIVWYINCHFDPIFVHGPTVAPCCNPLECMDPGSHLLLTSGSNCQGSGSDESLLGPFKVAVFWGMFSHWLSSESIPWHNS